MFFIECDFSDPLDLNDLTTIELDINAAQMYRLCSSKKQISNVPTPTLAFVGTTLKKGAAAKSNLSQNGMSLCPACSSCENCKVCAKAERQLG